MICLVAMSSTKRRIQSRSASTVGRVAARCGRRLDGVRVLITGVSAGLGVEMARALVAHGAHVVGAARDLGKAERAIGVVRDAARSGGGAFDLVALDLADLKSVLACADGLNEKADPFDLVIVNAGVMATSSGGRPTASRRSSAPTILAISCP